MPLPVVLFVALLALNLSSGRADDPTTPPSPPSAPNPPAPESTSEDGDARQAMPSPFDQIGKDCPPAACTTPLTCIDSKCDCEKPTDMNDCYCKLSGAGDHKYRRWEKDGADCKLAYGETCDPKASDKWLMCGPGLKCDKYCKVSATSVTSPYSVGALVTSALIMMILK